MHCNSTAGKQNSNLFSKKRYRISVSYVLRILLLHLILCVQVCVVVYVCVQREFYGKA